MDTIVYRFFDQNCSHRLAYLLSFLAQPPPSVAQQRQHERGVLGLYLQGWVGAERQQQTMARV